MNVALHARLDLISLCTGGGGLDLGVELAIPGARAVCLVEREAFAAAHLVSAMRQGLLADAPVWSDAGTFDGRAWRGCVDGVIGGIPCQPHSLAGRKRGSLDERDLWSAARRIIVQSRAWFVLIENVGGMLSAGADDVAGAERVWRDLRRLGFAVEAGLFTASEVGAPHERERIFVLGVADAGEWGCGPRRGHGAAGHGQPEFEPADGAGDLADASGGRQRGKGDPDVEATGLDWGRGNVVDAALVGRGEGRAEPGIRSGRPAAAGAGGAMDDAFGGRRTAGRDDHRGDVGHQPDAAGQYALVHAERAERRADAGGGYQPDRDDGGRDQAAGRPREPGALVEDAARHRGREGRTVAAVGEFAAGADDDRACAGLFPPGPSDFDGWRRVLEDSPQLEPAVRRMADGVAARVDLAGPHAARVERLRMLGNGVVSLEGAYAVTTLVARLAARGSAGAARLVRMMS